MRMFKSGQHGGHPRGSIEYRRQMSQRILGVPRPDLRAAGGALWVIAPDPRLCEAGGKHVPRTLERRDAAGEHTKTSVCHKCHHVV